MQKIRKNYYRKVDFCNVHEFCVKVTGNGGCFPEKYVFREEKMENLGCVSKVESMTAERKNLQNQKEIRAECRIFL